MRSRPGLVLACLAVESFVACGSDPTSTGFGTEETPEGGAADAAEAGAAPRDASDDAPSFAQTDGGQADAACNHLNIGILGNPGALPSSNFQAWLVSAGTTATRVQQNPSDTFTAATLAPFDVVVLDWLVRAYTAAEAAIFKAWIEAGHGAVSMTGYDNTANDFRANVFIATLGATYGGSLLSGPVTTFFPHPITAGLTSVTFAGGYAVTATGAGSNTLTALASLPAGNVAYAIQASSGRAFVWGDEWIEFDSEWSTLPEVKELWVNVFGWLAPKGCALTPPK